MSNAKQMAAMNKEDYNGKVKRNSRKKKKSFMEYAIWVDFPVNAGILTYVVVRRIQAALQDEQQCLAECSPFGRKDEHLRGSGFTPRPQPGP